MALRAKPRSSTGTLPVTDRQEAFLRGAPDYRPADVEAGTINGTKLAPRLKGNRHVVSQTFTPELLTRLDAYCAESGQSRAAVINRAVFELLSRQDRP